MTLLKLVAQQNLHFSENQKVIFDISVTKWVENVDGYERFLRVYSYIVETLEVIAHQLHLDKYPEWEDWDYGTRKRASACLGNIFKKVMTLI